MKRASLAGCVAAAVCAALPVPAAADPEIGPPTDPSCTGFITSGFAQQFGGIPNAADASNVTIKVGHNLIRGTLCGRTAGLVPIPPVS